MTQLKMHESMKYKVTEERLFKPEERFLLGFLKGFDRKTTQAWKDKGLLDEY